MGHFFQAPKIRKSKDILVVKNIPIPKNKRTPPKTNMEPENGPLEKEIPNLETIISRFQPLIFGGVGETPHWIEGSKKIP